MTRLADAAAARALWWRNPRASERIAPTAAAAMWWSGMACCTPVLGSSAASRVLPEEPSKAL